MPLIVTLIGFGVLFALEACGEIGAKFNGERELLRHHRVEHPKKSLSDAYLDVL